LHCGRLCHSTREVEVSNPAWARNQIQLSPVRRLLVIRSVMFSLRERRIRQVRGANCPAQSDRADCDPCFRMTSPKTDLIMTADLSSSVTALCRPVMICRTMAINVTVSLSLHLSAVCSVVFWCWLSAGGVSQQTVCCSCSVSFPWRNSSGSEVPEGRYYAVFSVGTPPSLSSWIIGETWLGYQVCRYQWRSDPIKRAVIFVAASVFGVIFC
jgi:hypothetical protein